MVTLNIFWFLVLVAILNLSIWVLYFRNNRVQIFNKEIIDFEEQETTQEDSTFPKPKYLGETHGNQKLYPKNPYLGQIILNKEFGISITRIWDGAQWCIVKGEEK